MMLSSLICFASFGWIKNYILIRNFILPIMDFNGKTFGKLYLFTFIIAALLHYLSRYKYK
jgi:hypothetical protein